MQEAKLYLFAHSRNDNIYVCVILVTLVLS